MKRKKIEMYKNLSKKAKNKLKIILKKKNFH